MKLPNGHKCVVPTEKLEGYALNPEHPVGGHKARVLNAALGLTRGHAEEVRATLLRVAATSQDAEPRLNDQHGQRYEVRFEMTGPNGETKTVLASWIVRTEEDFPRLTSFYLKE